MNSKGNIKVLQKPVVYKSTKIYKLVIDTCTFINARNIVMSEPFLSLS